MLSKTINRSSGWLFVGAIICSPFLYGGTTDQAIHILNVVLLAGALLWLTGLIIDRRRPYCPIPVFISVLILMGQGWWMTINAHAIHDPEFWQFAPYCPLVPWLPGSFDHIGSKAIMLRLTSLLSSFLAILDFSQRSRWVKRFQWSMAAAGIGVAALGIWQKMAFQPLTIWPVENVSSNTFATFWYHGNAAAFLNTTWPIAVGAAICAFSFGASHLLRSIWMAGSMLILSGLIINVSKAGHAIAAILLLFACLLSLLRWRSILLRYGWKHVLAASGVGITITLWIFMQFDHSITAGRWKQFLAREAWDSRFQVAGQCVDMLPQTGWFGSGPGTFASVHHQHLQKHSLDTRVAWKYAHNDYVQMIVEWGLPGSLAWLIIWGGAAAAGAAQIWKIVKPAFIEPKRRSRSSRERWRRSKEALLQVLMTAGTGSLATLLLHAAMDFPLQIYVTQLYGLALAGMLLSNFSWGVSRRLTNGVSTSAPSDSRAVEEIDKNPQLHSL